MVSRNLFRGLVIFFGVLLVMRAAPTSQAATFNAANEAELVTAINTANGNGAADTITLTADIMLTAALPQITSEITIEGGGFTIDGQGLLVVGSILFVDDTGNLTANNITLTGGALDSYSCPTGCGGGIYNTGTLTVTGSTLSSNSAHYGGGIYNTGTLTVTDSTLSGNSANGVGGGIYNLGTLTMTNSILSDNSASSAGGIYNIEGTLTVTDSTLSNNSATIDTGGGIVNLGTLTVTNSTISGSTAFQGGGIQNNGTLTVTNSTISDNTAEEPGGGIHNTNTLTITNSTISGNSANNGGGIFTYSGTLGTLTVTNSTLSNNSATNLGGGFYYDSLGTLTMMNSTISGNSANNGGGFYNRYTTSILTVTNSIIANSTSGGNCFNWVTTSGTNLADDATCTGFTESATINLEPLADNGGPTWTHAILSTSSAVDAAGVCGLTTDQRGFPRDTACDVGAFEFQQSPGIVILPDANPTTPPAPDVLEGSSRAFTVKVISIPSAAVTVPISVSDPAQCLVDVAEVVLDSTNWSTTVTVSGVDDGIVDGDQPCDLITGDPTSTDPDYDALTADDSPDVNIMIIDGNTIAINVTPDVNPTTPAPPDVAENGSRGFTFTLGSSPSDDVTIPISISDPVECSVDISEVVLTSTNWNTGVVATVSGIDDLLYDGDLPCNLITGDPTSTDTDYDALTATDSPNVDILIIDDEPPTNVNLLVNGDFTNGRIPWGAWGDYVANFGGGDAKYYRKTSGWKIATIYQTMNYTFQPDTPIEIQLDIGNTSSVPKGVEILLRDTNWNQVTLCAFTMPANSALQTMTVQDRLKIQTTDLSLVIRAFDRDGQAWIKVDNASVKIDPTLSITSMTCDGYPTAANTELMNNGDFSNGREYWILWGDFTFTVNAGVLEFYRNSGATRNAVLAQDIAHHLPVAAPVEMTLDLGNSSAVAKDVSVILRDFTWVQTFRCDFTIPANMALTTVTLRGTTIKEWGRPMLILRAKNADGIPAVLVDNVSLQYKSGLDTTTTCDGGVLAAEGLILAQPESTPEPTDPAPTIPPATDPPPPAATDPPAPVPTDPPASVDPPPAAAPTDPPPPPAPAAPTYTLADLEAALVCVTHGGASQSLNSHLDDLPQFLELLTTHTDNGNIDAACSDAIREIAEALIG